MGRRRIDFWFGWRSRWPGEDACDNGADLFAEHRFECGVARCDGLLCISISYRAGVGGVFGLAVALIADGLPEQVRSKALGWLQSLSAVGNVTAGLCSLALAGYPPSESWKYMFLIGSAPAFLCIFIMLKLKEPEKWVAAKKASKEVGGRAMGSYTSMFSEARWRKPAILGMILCVAGVVGLWALASSVQNW